jgi:hypothetical protein
MPAILVNFPSHLAAASMKSYGYGSVGWLASSGCFKCSEFSSQSAAARFVSSCSMSRAPMIGAVTPGYVEPINRHLSRCLLPLRRAGAGQLRHDPIDRFENDRLRSGREILPNASSAEEALQNCVFIQFAPSAKLASCCKGSCVRIKLAAATFSSR